MSQDRREIELVISAETQGGDNVKNLADQVDALAQSGGDAAPQFSALAAELRKLEGQQALINQFTQLKTETTDAAKALQDAQARAQALGKELSKTENPSRKLTAEFTRAKREVTQSKDALQAKQRALQSVRQSLTDAGLGTAGLAQKQADLRKATQATGQQAQQLAQSLQRTQQAGNDAAKGIDKTAQSSAKSAKEVKALGEQAERSTGLLGGLGVKAAAAFAALSGFIGTKFFGGAVKDAEKLDVQMRKLEGVIKATGGAAGLTAKELDDMARRLDEATTGSAAGFRDAAAQLLTFKSVGKDAFETTLMLAQDLADAGFGSVSANAVQLGKALEDPIQGLGALRRSGVSFTAEQQALIRSLVETGRAAEAQGMILEAVAGQVGGTAAAIGGGLTGAIDLVNKRLTDLREQLGKATLPVFEAFNNRLAEFYKRLTESGAIERFGQTLASMLQSASEAFFKFIENLNVEQIINKLRDWSEQTKATVEQWSQSLSTASDVASTAFNAIATGLNTLKAAFFGIAGVVAQWGSVVTGAFATVLEGMTAFSSRFQAAAEEARMVSDSFATSAQVNYTKAAEAIDAAAASGERLTDSFQALIGMEQQAATSTATATAEISKAGSAAGLTADQLDALGDGFEVVDGAARQAAAGINNNTDAAKANANALSDTADAVLDVDEAFKLLGITSSAELQRAADRAKLAFETIRDSGTATTEDLARAWEAYATRAKAANGGVADSALQATARINGMSLEAAETGRVIVTSMTEAAAATHTVGDAASRSADEFRSLANAAREAAAAQKAESGESTGKSGTSSRGRMLTGTEAARTKGVFVDRQVREQFDEIYKNTFEDIYNQMTASFARRPFVGASEYIAAMQRAQNEALSTAQRQTDRMRQPAAAAQSIGTVNINMGGKRRAIPTTPQGARELEAMLHELETAMERAQ